MAKFCHDILSFERSEHEKGDASRLAEDVEDHGSFSSFPLTYSPCDTVSSFIAE